MTTATRPLPTSRALLDEHYLPVEPVGPVLELRRRVALLRDRRRSIADELASTLRTDVDAVLEADELELEEVVVGVRVDPVLGYRLEVVDQALAVLESRLRTVEATDETFLAWRRRSADIVTGWNTAMRVGAGDDGDRVAARDRALRGFVVVLEAGA